MDLSSQEPVDRLADSAAPRRGGPSGERPSGGRPSGGRPWRLLSGLLLGATVLALGIAVFSYRSFDQGIAWQPEDAELAGRLAVLPVRNATGESQYGWTETGLTEMIAETLSRTRSVRVLAPARLLDAAARRGLVSGDTALRPRLQDLARAAGADLVLDAALRSTAPRSRTYALDFLVLDAADGEILARATVEGAEPIVLADRLTSSLAGLLAPGVEAEGMDQAFSPSPFLNQLYALGLEENRVDGGDPEAVFKLLLRYQPTFLQARARLAERALAAGKTQRARTLLTELLDQSQGRGERRLQARCLQLLGRVARAEGHREEAERLTSQALSIADAIDQPQTSLDILGELAALALEARAADPQAAVRAATLYDDILGRRRALEDQLGQIEALLALGELRVAEEVDKAAELFEEARDLAVALDDVQSEMEAVSHLADAARRRGRMDEAVTLWRRVRAYAAQRGDQATGLALDAKIAEASSAAGDLAAAEESLLSLLEIAATRGDLAAEADASLRLAEILLRRGFALQARAHLRRALELDRELPDRLRLQRAIARQAYEQGNYRLALDTQTAVKRQAEGAWSELDEKILTAYDEALAVGRRLPLPDDARAG